MDFVAIDFETANRKWSSACEVGIVVVEDDRVVEKYETLIRPTPIEFQYNHIRIHGITPERVINSPSFGELYDELLPFLENKHLVAHNASFDVGVLLGCMEKYALPKPTFTYSCTVQLARKVWPESYRHGLGHICHFLGIELDHHQALSDANGCAQIMLKAQAIYEAESTAQLLREVGVRKKKFIDFANAKRKKQAAWNDLYPS